MKSLLLSICLLFSTQAFSLENTTDAKFVEQTKQLTGVVYYSATWCPYCTKMEPIVKKMEQEFKQLKFLKLDVDESPKYGAIATSLPFMVFYKNGKILGAAPGYAPEETVRNFFKEFVEAEDIN